MYLKSFINLGSSAAFIDDLSLSSGSTIRHSKCHLLLPGDKQGVRCSECIEYRTVLTVQASRMQSVQQ